MEEQDFIAFMKQAKKPSGTINGYANSVRIFEAFLRSHQKGAQLEEAKPGDLRAFVRWAEANNENTYRHLFGIRTYYEYKRLANMKKSSWELMELIQNETRKLSEFPKADRDSIQKLSFILLIDPLEYTGDSLNCLLTAGLSLLQEVKLRFYYFSLACG